MALAGLVAMRLYVEPTLGKTPLLGMKLKCEKRAVAPCRNHRFGRDQSLQPRIRDARLHTDIANSPSRTVTESLNPQHETPGFVASPANVFRQNLVAAAGVRSKTA